VGRDDPRVFQKKQQPNKKKKTHWEKKKLGGGGMGPIFFLIAEYRKLNNFFLSRARGVPKRKKNIFGFNKFRQGGGNKILFGWKGGGKGGKICGPHRMDILFSHFGASKKKMFFGPTENSTRGNLSRGQGKTKNWGAHTRKSNKKINPKTNFFSPPGRNKTKKEKKRKKDNHKKTTKKKKKKRPKLVFVTLKCGGQKPTPFSFSPLGQFNGAKC